MFWLIVYSVQKILKTLEVTTEYNDLDPQRVGFIYCT